MSGTPAACTVLAAELQRLRARHNLSLGALAERTPFSKSSWGRHLNGKAPPPWQAFQHLCALVDEPEGRFRALWNVAEAAWNQRDAVSSSPERPAQPTRAEPAQSQKPEPPGAEPASAPEAPQSPDVPDNRPQGRFARRTLPVLLGTVVLLGALVGLVWRGLTAHPAPPVAAVASASAHPVRCVGRACDGKDPGTMDCGVYPQSLGVFPLQHGTELEVRYSSQCQAAWARVWASQVGDRVSISNGADVMSRVVPDPYTAQTFFYTMMMPLFGHGPALHASLTHTDRQSQCVSVREP